LLDVGCASGLFLDAARRYGDWDVEGLEPSASASEYARHELGLCVHVGGFGEVPLEPGSYDVVTMWDVLEHLHDPVRALGLVAQLLKPGGILVVRVPHVESWQARIFGRCWAGLDSPRHLYAFPRRLLADMLQEAGLEPVRWHCWGGYLVFALSVRLWLRAHLDRGARRDRLERVLDWLPVRVAAFPWFALVDQIARRGPALAYVAKRTVPANPRR
jgi:SAM-dependent methyltransferase